MGASLRREPGGIVFSYTAEHVAAGGGAVATTLPVSRDPVRTPAGAVPVLRGCSCPKGDG